MGNDCPIVTGSGLRYDTYCITTPSQCIKMISAVFGVRCIDRSITLESRTASHTYGNTTRVFRTFKTQVFFGHKTHVIHRFFLPTHTHKQAKRKESGRISKTCIKWDRHVSTLLCKLIFTRCLVYIAQEQCCWLMTVRPI